ncbi:MAG: hypothetical protein JXQ90_23845 [Cyclobacteriaceae bacterium]
MTLLKNTLRANALNAFASGSILILFSSKLAKFIGLEQSEVLLVLGAVLLVFGSFVSYSVRHPGNQLVMSIVIQDALWVVVSAAILIFNPWGFTDGGLMLIGAMMLLVALFAVLQFVGIKKG